jgi:hypothetical protein
MSSGDQSKLITSLNILITGKALGKTEPEKFGLGTCLKGIFLELSVR